MARLPNEEWLVQSIGGDTVVFRESDGYELVRVPSGDPGAIGPALRIVATTSLLDLEDRALALFWLGYFHAHAAG